jgi:PII-like signaling protein
MTTAEYLKLTTYFAERLRTEDRFVADALLDLYSHAGVATSVVLRGIASFGPRHQLRSDQSLSLSEDPPIAVAAVDTADTMAALADRAVAMTTRGLITLERARLVDTSAAPAPDTAKLTVYVGRQDRIAGRPAHHVICEVLHAHGFAGASVFLGVDGTKRGQRRRARFFSRNVDVPVMTIAVGTAPQVGVAIADLETMLSDPLYTVERVQLCKRDGRVLARPAALPPTDGDGRQLWQKLMIYTSEATLHDGVPIHRALVRRLFDTDAVSGATVLRGIWGFHGDHEPHGDKLVQLSRQVPVTTIVVDTPARIAAGFDIVDELTGAHGLVTSELVPALVAVDGADRVGDTRLARFEY